MITTKIRSSIATVYNSIPANYWLFGVNILLFLEYLLNPHSFLSIIAIPTGLSLVIGWFMFNNGEEIVQFLIKNRTFLTLIFAISIGTIIFHYTTEPSHAFILTDSGVVKLKALFNMGGANTTNADTDKFVDALIAFFRVAFFILFAVSVYRAYEKYTQQSEWGEVIITPIVLLFTVAIIDAVAGIF